MTLLVGAGSANGLGRALDGQLVISIEAKFGSGNPLAYEGESAGYCQVNGETAEAPGRMGNVSCLRVLTSFGKLVQRERKAVTQHQSGGYGNACSLT